MNGNPNSAEGFGYVQGDDLKFTKEFNRFVPDMSNRGRKMSSGSMCKKCILPNMDEVVLFYVRENL